MSKSTEGIINKLKRGQYEKLDTIVKNHLSKLKTSTNNSEVVKFTHSFVTNVALIINTCDFKDSIFLIKIALRCNECFWKEKQSAPDITKALYDVLEFLLKQNAEIDDTICDLILTTSQHLEKCLENADDGNEVSKKICYKAYFYLSKFAKECVKKRKKGVRNDDAGCFDLQKLALKFLAGEKDAESLSKLCERALAFALDYIDTGKTDFPSLILYYDDTFRHVCELFDSVEKNLSSLTAVFNFLFGWLPHLLNSAAVWKVDPLSIIENWYQLSSSLKRRPSLQLLWNCNVDAMKLSAIFHSLPNANKKSKKDVEDAISRCVTFLRKNKDNEMMTKSLLFCFDSIKKNFILLDRTKSNNFGFYCQQIGNLLLEFMNWEFSKDKSYKYKTWVILRDFFSLLVHGSKNILKIAEDSKIENEVEALGNILHKFGNAFVKFGILNYNKEFAYSVSIIAHAFYEESLWKYAVLVCSLSQEHMMLISTSNSSSEYIEECFWSFAGRYVRSLKKLQRHDDSLDFIARVLAADCKDRDQAFELWTYTKMSGNEMTKVSVFDLVSKYICDGKKVDFNSLLFMEANSTCDYSLRHRIDVSDKIPHVVNQLKCETIKGMDKGVLLMTKAKLLGVDSNNLDKKLLSYCDEAKEIFIRQASRATCYLAHTYFYRYVIETRLKCNKLAEKTKTDSAKPKPSNYASIPFTLKRVGGLDSALNIWTSAISSDMKLIPCLKNCLTDLLGIASAYSVQCMTKNEFKSWMLALKVAKELNDDLTAGNVSCQIAFIFCRYGLTVQATEYLLGAKEALENANDKVVGDDVKEKELKYLKLLVDVCNSESLLLQNEIIKGWQCLRNVLKEIEVSKKTVTIKLLSIEARCLKSKYLELPFSILPLSERDSTTPLVVLYYACIEGFWLLKNANDYRFADINSRIINSFMDCAMYLGKMCLSIGDPTMTSQVLQWTLQWAYEFSLSKRISDIFMLKAKINILSDDFETCASNLRVVKYIFESQEENALDENELDEDKDLDQGLLVNTTNINNFEDTDTCKDKYHLSPVLENSDMKDHLSNCVCALCEQLLFPISCLEFSFLQAQSYHLKDDYRHHAFNILRKKRQKFEILSSAIASLILGSLSFENKKFFGISNSNVYSSFYIVKLNILNKLITFSLEKGDLDEAHVMAKAAVEETKTYFWIGLQDLRVATAQIKYSYCLVKLLKHAKSQKLPLNDIFNRMWSYSTHLPAAEIDGGCEFDFVESKLGKINGVDLAKNFQTPKQNARPAREVNCKAPGRIRVMSVRPNQFDEFFESKESEDKENEDTGNFSNKNVRRKLVLSEISTGPFPENKVGKSNKKRNGERSERTRDLVTDKFVRFLEAVIEEIAHFPVYPLYGDLHLLLALCKGNRRTDSGIHLFETFGLTLRHRSLFESSSRVQKCNDSYEPAADKYEKTFQYICSFIHLTTNVDKNSEEVCINYEKRLNDLTSLLDEGMVVCQINTLPKTFYEHSQQLNSELIITRLQKDRQPLLIKVPNDNSKVVKGFLSNFQTLIDEHNDNCKVFDWRAWHTFRVDANDKIKLALTDIENRWLGHWKGLLLGTPTLEQDRKTLRKIVEKLNLKFLKFGFSNINLYILEMIVDSLPWLSSSQLRQALSDLLFSEMADSSLLAELCKKVRHYAKPLDSKTVSRNLLILVLDKSISYLPWESIPILANNTVTRMPSIYSILVHASLNKCPKPIDSSKTFYVLDPDNNLPGMARRFDSFLKSLNWSGICQRRPTKDEWEAAIKDNELFFYSGHGNGRQFYDSKSLTKQVCKSSLILAGCSSVKLGAVNYFEASGDVIQYIMAGSPCVVGTLWIVTDVEIDSVVKKLLDTFLPSSAARKTMCEALIAGRAACKFRYLTGAGTIIYGMPVVAK